MVLAGAGLTVRARAGNGVAAPYRPALGLARAWRRCSSSSQSIRAVTSAGLTPGTREACPKVWGSIAASFSRAYRDRVPMLA